MSRKEVKPRVVTPKEGELHGTQEGLQNIPPVTGEQLEQLQELLDYVGIELADNFTREEAARYVDDSIVGAWTVLCADRGKFGDRVDEVQNWRRCAAVLARSTISGAYPVFYALPLNQMAHPDVIPANKLEAIFKRLDRHYAAILEVAACAEYRDRHPSPNAYTKVLIWDFRLLFGSEPTKPWADADLDENSTPYLLFADFLMKKIGKPIKPGTLARNLSDWL